MNFLAVAILIAGMLAAPVIIQSAYAANTLTVRAYSDDGKSLSMYATIKSGNTTVKSGFTPLTYAGTIGKTYTVTVSNYKDIVFHKWVDSEDDRSRTLKLSGDPFLTAYYSTGP